MLRLRECIVFHLLSSPSKAAFSPLRRLLSTTAASVSSNQGFAVEDYLVGTCGLTRPQALKASTKLSHLKSPANPDNVLSFVAGLGLSGADAAAVVAKDPQFLCAKVGKTLAPVVAGLTGLGLSSPEIGRLVLLAHKKCRSRSIVSKLQYYLPLFGSFQTFLRVLKHSSPPSSMVCVPRMLTTNPESVRAMVACAERLVMPRGSGMLRQALQAVAFLNEEKIADKVEYLKNTFRWSAAEVVIALSKVPMLLKISKDMLQRKSEFLLSEVGSEPVYIAHRSVILCLSLEGRVRPRYYVLKFLKENGLVDRDLSFHTAVNRPEKYFMEKLISPHKEAAPHLAEDYATACKGKCQPI